MLIHADSLTPRAAPTGAGSGCSWFLQRGIFLWSDAAFTSLEVELRGNLHDSRTAARSVQGAEPEAAACATHIARQVDNIPLRVEQSEGVERRPLGVIEDVEGLQTKLGVCPLRKVDLLEQRHVPLMDARAAHAVAAGVDASAAFGRRSE